MKIGIVTSKFNWEVTEKLESGARRSLSESGIPDEKIVSVRVPGAVEIPLTCQKLIEMGMDGVIALGAVIRGETTHYDVVCSSVERGITQVMLDTGRPIAMGVLTTENEEQALARAGGAHGNKGHDAAVTVLEMIELFKNLKDLKKKSINKKRSKK